MSTVPHRRRPAARRSPWPLGATRRARALPALPPAVTVVLGVFAGVVLLRRAFSPDTYFDLYAGRLIAHHGLPQHNVLTAVGHGREWMDQQWLGHLALFGADALAGPAGIVALSAAAVAITAGLCFTLLRERLAGVWALEATVLVLAALESNMAPRAQTLCYPLWCVVLWIVAAQPERLTPRRSAIVLATLVVWANVHGSVLLGATAVAACCAVHAWRLPALRRRFALLAAGATLSPLATPYGTGIARYYRSVLSSDAVQASSSEWQRPAFDLQGLGFLVVLAIALLIAFHFRRQWRALASPAGFIAIAVAVLALHSVRFGAWFGVPAAIALTRVDGLPSAHALGVRALRAIAATALAACLVAVAALAATSRDTFQPGASPSLLAAVDRALQAHPDSLLLGDSTVAPAVLWASPAAAGRVLYDIRWELYSAAETRRYDAVLQGDLGAIPHAWRCTVIATGGAGALRGALLRRPPGFVIASASPSGVVALSPRCAAS